MSGLWVAGWWALGQGADVEVWGRGGPQLDLVGGVKAGDGEHWGVWRLRFRGPGLVDGGGWDFSVHLRTSPVHYRSGLPDSFTGDRFRLLCGVLPDVDCIVSQRESDGRCGGMVAGNFRAPGWVCGGW
ncbi:hypothetical protein Tco_0522431 [Tanacetum coccineum]